MRRIIRELDAKLVAALREYAEICAALREYATNNVALTERANAAEAVVKYCAETMDCDECAVFVRDKGGMTMLPKHEPSFKVQRLQAENAVLTERVRQWENRADTAEMANTALTERLQVAEERILTAREGWDAMKDAHREYDANAAWYQVEEALASTSDATPKEEK